MGKIVRLVSLSIVLFVVPTGALAETIERFDTTIDLHPDHTFTVTEEITFDFGDEDRHGIFRYIPLRHPQEASSWYKGRYLTIDVTAVTVRDQLTAVVTDVPYLVTKSGEEVSIKIGDPNKTISGVHTYALSYQVDGGLSYFEDGSVELYWNTTGTLWDVPIQVATTRIQTSDRLIGKSAACYAGVVGTSNGGGQEASPKCSIKTQTLAETYFVSSPLMTYEGLTVAQKINHSALEGEPHIIERIFAAPFLLIPSIFWILYLIYAAYRHKTFYKKDAPLIAIYEPYEKVSPMYAGVLIDGTLHPRDVTSGLMYLAEQGFIKITRTTRKALFFIPVTDYELTLRRDPQEIKSSFLRNVLSLVFPGLAQVGDTTSLFDVSKRRQKNTQILRKLQKDLKRDIALEGYTESSTEFIKKTVLGSIIFLILLIGTYYFMFQAGLPQVLWLGQTVLLIILVPTLIICVVSYTRKTKKGYEAIRHLQGFKDFLSVTDKERFSFHNAPEKNPEEFMQYLPYAVAFGVEDAWAQVFKDVSLPQPDWYEGDGHTFSATSFTSDISTFSSSFSSASGTSGSSGGGSVGGGGGGGGGGSW